MRKISVNVTVGICQNSITNTEKIQDVADTSVLIPAKVNESDRYVE